MGVFTPKHNIQFGTLFLYFCMVFQQECDNFIRTLHTMEDSKMLVCGTNAFNPVCDYMVSIFVKANLEYTGPNIKTWYATKSGK